MIWDLQQGGNMAHTLGVMLETKWLCKEGSCKPELGGVSTTGEVCHACYAPLEGAELTIMRGPICHNYYYAWGS